MASITNSSYRPAEVLWHKGEAVLISERETFEDYYSSIKLMLKIYSLRKRKRPLRNN